VILKVTSHFEEKERDRNLYSRGLIVGRDLDGGKSHELFQVWLSHSLTQLYQSINETKAANANQACV